MTDHYKSNSLSQYESAVLKLEQDPNNIEAKHSAVLALARMGSLQFALSKYKRYGLDRVSDDEDVIALEGRLYKDLYLTSDNHHAKEYALNASHRYEAAFDSTTGFYSGINSATMALIAGLPNKDVQKRVSDVLQNLPEAELSDAESYYFIEATRAEAFLLQGRYGECKKTLKRAIDFDPLNYFAHASTLKQFKMILDFQGLETEWLKGFTSPKPIHYAGHIWSSANFDEIALKEKIADLIQTHDVGFAYGALAAGADILIAEALIDEGVELNVILPATVEAFIENSILPYGQAWLPRFQNCLGRAHSIRILPIARSVNSASDTLLAARMAMGQAIMRSAQFGVDAIQLLIIDENRLHSLTHQHKIDWLKTDLDVIKLPISQNMQTKNDSSLRFTNFPIIVAGRKSENTHSFDTIENAMSFIEHQDQDVWALHFDIPGAKQELQKILNTKIEGVTLVSDVLAGCLALSHPEQFRLSYAGFEKASIEEAIHYFAISY